MDFRRGHRVTNVFRKRSQGHGRISAVTNCDPGRGRMYGSDHPLCELTCSLCSSGIVLQVWLSDGWNITAGRSLVARANGGLNNHAKRTRAGAELIVVL